MPRIRHSLQVMPRSESAAWRTHVRAGAVAVCTAAALWGCCATATDHRPTYQVRRVIDGDTIEIVDAGGIRTRVRLRDVDAPEMDEPGGPEAKATLERQVLGRKVYVPPYARDRYGRLVANIAPTESQPEHP